MKMFKRLFILIITTFFVVSTVMGQSGKSNQEMSIEESYLQEALELMIIDETARSNELDQKYIALEHIANALERGSTNEKLRINLEVLALESTQNQVREGRRLVNNFPGVRRQAVKYLGVVGTKEAKTALIKVCVTDNEPMVIQEAVKSLGIIGINDNDDAVDAIIRATDKFHNSGAPNDILAIAAIDAIEKFAQKDQRLNQDAIQLLMKISSGPYVPSVKEKARQALVKVGRYATQNK
jgi:HEAT repeat protein